MPTSVYDAIIVGAGHNGLAAGVMLARAGWKVLILESHAQPGGAVRTTEATLPGFRHDLYATNLNAFAASELVADFRSELATAGLEFLRAQKVFCSIFPDGDLVGVTTSLEETLSDIGRHSARDARAWAELKKRFARIGPPVLSALRQPMPSRKALWQGLRNLPLICQTSGNFVRGSFENEKIQALWAVWGMHLDFPPEVRGGALYPYMQCMLTQANGISFGRGGAANMIDALCAVFRRSGGELRSSSRVTDIVVDGASAVAVKTNGGDVSAKRAVIANLAPKVLFDLLKRPLRKRYRHGPGTMMIHLALSGVPEWRNERARHFAYVHVGPSLGAMSDTYWQAMQGVLPSQPVLVVAQPTVVDPSRAPKDRHILSIQVRVVPSAADWDAIKERYADHVVALLERYAPRLSQKIIGRRVLSPRDLETENPNLIGGDQIGGSHHLDQQFLFRPFFGWWHYRTPINKLYMCGASTWPGAGVGAGSGYLLGKRLTAME